MILKIPTTNSANQKIYLQVNGQNVYIILNRSFFGRGWFLSVYKEDGTPLSQSRRIDSGVSILSAVYASGFIGDFMAMPTQKKEQPVGEKPWGDTHELLYYDANL